MVMTNSKSKPSLPAYELSIVRSFAGAIESACRDYHFDVCDFLQKVFYTDVFTDYEEEHCLYTQGSHCIAGKLLENMHELPKKIEDPVDAAADAPVAHWMGYLFMYWKLLERKTGHDFLKVDLERVYWSYEVLHTQSITYAIDMVKENAMIA